MRRNSFKLLAAVAAATPAICLASAVNLGGAGSYAVLGLGNTATPNSSFEVYQSGTVINGDVGVGAYSTFSHGIDATINGSLDYQSHTPAQSGDVTLPAITGTISGGTTGMVMNRIVQDAIAASNAAASLTPDVTLSTLAEGGSINATGQGQYVVNVTGGVTLKTTFSLIGGANDKIVINLGTAKDVLTLSGVVMSLSGGITADNILWNLNAPSDTADVSITSGNCLVYGTFLAPYRDITVDGADVIGQVIGGGGGRFLSIHSTSSVTLVPEPAVLGLLALTSVSMLARRQRRAH